MATACSYEDKEFIGGDRRGSEGVGVCGEGWAYRADSLTVAVRKKWGYGASEWLRHAPMKTRGLLVGIVAARKGWGLWGGVGLIVPTP